jgi:hypothetical protein
MSDFHELLDEYIGDADALSDIRVMVRRLWFYDFDGYPLRIWQGKGRLFTSDDQVWMGSIDPMNNDVHKTPAIQDGRDGSSATYSMSLSISDIPGQTAFELYEAMKAEQWRVSGRNITCYLAIFKEGELLRPSTPIVFFKELKMFSPKFSEVLETGPGGELVRRYRVTINTKDNNFGRSNIPNGTYADTIQKQRAKELGVTYDRGCEFLALLANRTYQIP